jgi:hypothetical protein
VLKNIGFLRNKAALPYLMEWFQDINFPGIPTVIELLKDIEIAAIIPNIEMAAQRAISEKDSEWCYGLLHLIEQLKIQNISDDLLKGMSALTK